MKLDLKKLYNLNKLEIDKSITIPENYYLNMGIVDIKDVHVKGIITPGYETEIEFNLNVKGSFLIPCSITLESVLVPFQVDINDTIDESVLINEFNLDLLQILWENIVLEVPLQVKKEGTLLKEVEGNGWQVLDNDDKL